jgi:hypothetical protein
LPIQHAGVQRNHEPLIVLSGRDIVPEAADDPARGRPDSME